jgi:hypothetical protein
MDIFQARVPQDAIMARCDPPESLAAACNERQLLLRSYSSWALGHDPLHLRRQDTTTPALTCMQHSLLGPAHSQPGGWQWFPGIGKPDVPLASHASPEMPGETITNPKSCMRGQRVHARRQQSPPPQA